MRFYEINNYNLKIILLLVPYYDVLGRQSFLFYFELYEVFSSFLQ